MLLRLSPVALGAMLAFSTPARAPLAKGFTYDFVQRTKSMNPMNGGSQELVGIRGKVLVDAAGHMRMDVKESGKNPMWDTGDYALMSTSSVLIVSPQKKEFLELGADMGTNSMQDFMKQMNMDMKVTDGAITLDSLPGTELINGQQTKHFVVTRESSTEMTTPMGAMAIPTKSQTDYYVMRGRAPQNSAMAGQTASLSPTSVMSPESAQRTRAMMASMKGFAVRIVSHTSTTLMGMTTEATSTTDIENLQEVEVAPIPAAAPAGYTKVNLVERIRAMSPRGPG